MNGFEALVTLIVPTVTGIVAYWKIKRTAKQLWHRLTEEYIPTLAQQILTDVGDQLSEQISSPTVSAAMSVLGKKSGVVRAEQATVNKFNENVGNLIPSIGLIAGRLDMTPVELMSLWNDPIIGGFIQSMAGSFLKGKGSKDLNTGKHPFLDV